MKLIICCIIFLYRFTAFSGEIAISFDDASMSDSSYMKKNVRAKMLVESLKKGGVYQAAFFVNTITLKQNNAKSVLHAYDDAGHILGNHTHSHRGLKRLSSKEFIEDIDITNRILDDLREYANSQKILILLEKENR